jgi:murein L,D-transpeptidase YafK
MPGFFVCLIRYVVGMLVVFVCVAGCSSQTAKKSMPATTVQQVVMPQLIHADKIIIEKSRHLLTVYQQEREIATFPVALSQVPVGPKTCVGDKRTPEGIYTVLQHKKDSDFYRALRLSYPSPTDIARARRQGCQPGGDIMIHGLENGYGWVGTAHRSADWTKGCIAVTNEEMDRLWTLVLDGTTVEIRP